MEKITNEKHLLKRKENVMKIKKLSPQRNSDEQPAKDHRPQVQFQWLICFCQLI